MLAKEITKGLITRIPGWQRLRPKRSGGSTHSAQYCYAVWIKHIAMLQEQGITRPPERMAELGPGNALGVGLAALLSGVNHYTALDVVPYAAGNHDLQLLQELAELLRERRPYQVKGWPDFSAYLDSNGFPSGILSNATLDAALAPQRVAAIAAALRGEPSERVSIRYVAPWQDASVIEPDSIDFVLSHSVLEHVTDLAHTYRSLHRWLRPGGLMSHQIDLTAHGLAAQWDGYRAYPDWLWRLIVGNRLYLINRAPQSEHAELLQDAGFRLRLELKALQDRCLPTAQLAPRWQHLNDTDRHCSGTLIQAQK